MSEELDELIKKLQREGVEKANNEAGKILSDARAKATEIIKTAEHTAEELRAKAVKDAEANAQRSTVALQQAARDVTLSVEKAVTAHLENLLKQNVREALKDPATVGAMVKDAMTALASDKAEVAVASGELAEMLRAQFAGQAAQGVTVVMDETVGNGFKVRTDSGRVEHDFTGKTIAAALSARVHESLRKLF